MNNHDYLTEDDLRSITPEVLDQWFPAWRQVASDLLRGAVAETPQSKPLPDAT